MEENPQMFVIFLSSSLYSSAASFFNGQNEVSGKFTTDLVT